MNEFTSGQRTAIETTNCNLLVKAGAGAGKTRVLVERYIRILELGLADLEGIVAITFTRKAAREMKERVRTIVDEKNAASQTSEGRNRWRSIGNRLDTVNISTIHSLCSRILREHPAEAGIDPDFRLMAELDEEVLIEEIWQRTLEQALRSDAGWLGRLLAVYSPAQIRRDFRPLFDVVLEEGWSGDDLAKRLWPEPAVDTHPFRLRLKQAYRNLFALIPAGGKKTAAQLVLSALREEWSEIETGIDRSEANPLLLEELDLPFKGLRGSADLREALQERKHAGEALRGAVLDRVSQQMVPDLCEWFNTLTQEWDRVRRKCRVLTYDDLEKEAERLLREHPDICARYNRRIQFVMVDECQDINDRQRKIIYLLAGGHADQLRRQTLFAVGDEKQSIYRFRGADAQVFARIQTDVCSSGGRVVELLDNFRSHRQLVSAFNDFFSELMPASVCEEDADGADTVEYRKLQGERGEEGKARIDLWVLDAEQLSGANTHDQEAAMIASRIRSLVEDSPHPVRYGDIALLLRAFTHVAVYEAAFAREGIPYYVAGSRGFAGKQEIVDALGLLRFLCNPWNEIALFGLLRSPFFQLSDEALLRLRCGNKAGLWQALADAAEIGGLSESEKRTALEARIVLEKCLERRGFLSPPQLLREAFEATGFDSFQLTQFMGERRYANLMKLLDMADQFTAVEAGGIADFISYVETRAGSEGEAEIDSEAGDTVRIMTVHKSKGLEFPVVIVPDLQRKFNYRTGLSVFVRGWGMGLKVPGRGGELLESGRFRRVARQDYALERAELKRILYVAMTRAERHIILSAVANNPKKGKTMRNASGWLDWVRHLFELEGPPQDWPAEKRVGEAVLHVCLDEGALAGRSPTLPQREKFAVMPAKELPADISRNIGNLDVQRNSPLALSPSYIPEYVFCPRQYFYSHLCRMPQFETMGPPISSRSPAPGSVEMVPELTARKMGIAFHRFLELLVQEGDWQDSLVKAVRDTLPQTLRETGTQRLRDWARLYVGSSLYSEMSSLLQDRKEWAFQYRVLPTQGRLPAVWISGQVDRLLFYPDGELGIVDYKTDRMEGQPVGEKIDRYRLQLAAYALAAKAVFGRKVKDARLYFVRTGETETVDVSEETMKSALEEVRKIASFLRSHNQEPEYACILSQCPFCPYEKLCPQK